AIASNAWVRGTSGIDSLNGAASADTLFGDKGNDYLQGNGGSDTYVYRSGDGNDEIADRSNSATDVDTLKFTDLNASDITLSRSGNNLLVTINATGETIKVDDQFYSQTANWGVEKLLFANGESWDLPTIASNAWVRGTSGNDSMTLPANGITVDAGTGDDTLSVQGSGSDRIFFSKGYGHDTLNNPGWGYNRNDTLVLTDINASDVQLSRSGDAMTLKVLSTGDTFTASGQFYAGETHGLTNIQFADGTIWNSATIASNAWVRGTSGIDSLNGAA